MSKIFGLEYKFSVCILSYLKNQVFYESSGWRSPDDVSTDSSIPTPVRWISQINVIVYQYKSKQIAEYFKSKKQHDPWEKSELDSKRVVIS